MKTKATNAKIAATGMIELKINDILAKIFALSAAGSMGFSSIALIVPNWTYLSNLMKFFMPSQQKAKELNISLRDFDRALFGMDFYEGRNGLREFAVDFSDGTGAHIAESRFLL